MLESNLFINWFLILERNIIFFGKYCKVSIESIVCILEILYIIILISVLLIIK